MASGLITDYLGSGLLSARPASPSVPSGGTALYYATDTAAAYVWTGSAWVTMSGSGGSLSLAQKKYVSNVTASAGITLTSAPTNGQLIVLSVHGSASFTASAGWTRIINNTAPNNMAFVKVAGSSESATQTFTATAGTANISAYVFSNWLGVRGTTPTAQFTSSITSNSFSSLVPTYYGSAAAVGTQAGYLISQVHVSSTGTSITAVSGLTSTLDGTGAAQSSYISACASVSFTPGASGDFTYTTTGSPSLAYVQHIFVW